ncbi:UNVERIFIED_CONTAM: hypothetical protein Sangu_3098100 [Sesamum angustifolium]|uniref:Integrase catalytic domain-containing protein n=1 Tax=Sesamum angustifolium TaxID=2727405 RepID=A0AAW2K6T4_9LAMI
MTAQHKRKLVNHDNAHICHMRLGHISKDRMRKLVDSKSLEWTLPRTPQLNGVAERRNQTLMAMVRFMISFTELPPSFWNYVLETATKLLNMAASKTVSQRPYEIWHDKPASYKYLRVWGSPAYVKRLVRDKLHSRSSLCNFIDIRKKLRTRESRPLDRYGFLRVMSDIDSDKWIEAMRSEMHSIGSNQVLSLVDPPKGVKPIGCKWLYKRKLGADGEVTVFKARVEEKGYT